MICVTKRVSFSAAHRLYNPEFSDEQNAAIFGKCNNPMGHGHNYDLEVTVCGNPNPQTGMVIDLKKLKDILVREIVERVDHKHLNYDVPFMNGVIPTAENLVLAFWNILEEKIDEGHLFEIKLYETPNNIVSYRGE
jgi:6-pyruvoyltetrahydropterin/6-carboxytetrahydropterin synthase